VGESEMGKDEEGRNKIGSMLKWNGTVERMRGIRDALYILYTTVYSMRTMLLFRI
jgi:hypothetical protein